MNHNKEELLKDMLKRRAIDELGIDPLAPNSIELLNVEIEKSVKRKRQLMRLEKEMLVDMVFNLESRNEMLVNNLSEVEKMYNKLSESKPIKEWAYADTVAGMRYYRCPTCTDMETLADENEVKWWRFCPRCGAKMFTKEEK